MRAENLNNENITVSAKLDNRELIVIERSKFMGEDSCI